MFCGAMFVKAVHVDCHIDGILRLPCVCSVRKCSLGLEYTLYLDKLHHNATVTAHIGDWLCEGVDGLWYLLSNDEYTRLCATNKVHIS